MHLHKVLLTHFLDCVVVDVDLLRRCRLEKFVDFSFFLKKVVSELLINL